ncbi:MAG: hypothetical protein IPM28_09565 [Chloracidobacterium sp.]|nr:hypothetical protein [Chloracidobacterium sp.]
MEEYNGRQTIDWLYEEQLHVDDAWAVRTSNGFKWWPYKTAQTVEVIGKEIGPDGQHGFLISVRTDFLRGVTLDEEILRYLGSILMPISAMCGPVYDEASGTLSLCSLVRVHKEISGWMNPLISLAAATQISEAFHYARIVTDELDVKEAISEHPSSGLRPEPDEIAGVFESLIAPLGGLPCRWSHLEFADVAASCGRGLPSLILKQGGAGVNLDFPFGDQSSPCRLSGNFPHPVYGNGLFMLQSFPTPEMSEMAGIRLALELNRRELTRKPTGYGFGSYAYRDNSMHFAGFFPNLIYSSSLLPNLVYSCAERSRVMSLTLDSENSFETYLMKMGPRENLVTPRSYDEPT